MADGPGIAVKDIEPAGRIQAFLEHKAIVAEWAAFMVNQGKEVQVLNAGDGIIEGVAF